MVVVDFYATWCGPCKGIAPKFAKLAAKHENVLFMKVDVDEAEEIVANFDVRLMPTFIFLLDGKQIDIVEGALEERLLETIAKYH